MSETDLLQLSAARHRVSKLYVALERDLCNALCVYEPSDQTRRLASEANRELFAELVAFRNGGKCRPFESATPERVSKSVPKRLATVVVEYLVNTFKGGPEPCALSCCQKHEFGSILSTDLHLLKIIDLENEAYWRRVVWCHSANSLSYHEHDFKRNINWKRHGIELKLARLIELQDPRYWELEALEETVKKAAPFVEDLSIEQLMPFPSVEPFEEYESYTFYNTPDALCHHGSLALLGHLLNLTSLSLVFGVRNWTKPYQRRYSNFSLADIENLGIGLQKLTKLKSFTLSRSRMDPQKLTVLVQSLVLLPLATIHLNQCQLGVGCGAILGRFLSRFGPTLKQLDFSGNRLDALELDQLCPGLGVYQGVVDKLDLSYNPIGESGVLILGGAIRGKQHLSELNFTGCLMGVEGSLRVRLALPVAERTFFAYILHSALHPLQVIQLMSFHTPLRAITMDCVPISPEGHRRLVEVLQENMQIEAVHVRECGLSEEARNEVRRILNTNAKRRSKIGSSTKVKKLPNNEDNLRKSPASLFQLNRNVFAKNHEVPK